MSAAPHASEYDVVVVGAGVAGCALATVLARDGRRVFVVERDLSEPDRIVGELLQPGGYEKLVELGLASAAEGIDSQKVYGYGMFLYDRRMCIDYIERRRKRAGTGVERAVAGRSFHNGRFVMRLREAARAERNVTLAQGNVLRLVHEDADDENSRVLGVEYRDTSCPDATPTPGVAGQLRQARAALTIACDGCSSRLRKKVNPAAEFRVSSHFVGLVLQHCDLPFPQHGHVVLIDPAPVLFYPISSTEVRCLVDVPGGRMPSAADGGVIGYMRDTVAPQLPDAFRGAFLRAVHAGDFKTMPNRVMPAKPAAMRGAILLGDSFNMRHPLTGGGMTVALSDVSLIRALLRQVADLREHRQIVRGLQRFYRERKPLSSTINILANALYAVMCATDDPSLKEMRLACFDYLGAGGRRSTDPMSMLGGIRPSPYLLALHFFAVAVFGCGRVLLPVPTPARVAKAWTLFRAAFNIVKPLIDAEGVTVLSYLPLSHLGPSSGFILLAAALAAVGAIAAACASA